MLIVIEGILNNLNYYFIYILVNIFIRLAKHLVSLYYPDHANLNQRLNTVSQEFLKDYIYYCRHNSNLYFLLLFLLN